MGAVSNLKTSLAGQARASQMNRPALGRRPGTPQQGQQQPSGFPETGQITPERGYPQPRSEDRGGRPRAGLDLGPGRGRRFIGMGGF